MKNLDELYVEKIAKEYASTAKTKEEKIMELDHYVKRPANIFAFTFGVFSSLILGAGLSMILLDFHAANSIIIVFGIVFGLAGLILCAINYPIYVDIINYRKAKYASQIIELTNEVLKEKE